MENANREVSQGRLSAAFARVADKFLSSREVSVSPAFRLMVAAAVVATTALAATPSEAAGFNFEQQIKQKMSGMFSGGQKTDTRYSYGGRSFDSRSNRNQDAYGLELSGDGLKKTESSGGVRTRVRNPRQTNRVDRFDNPTRFRAEVDDWMRDPNLGNRASDRVTHDRNWRQVRSGDGGYVMYASNNGEKVWLDNRGRVSDYRGEPAVQHANGAFERFNNGRLAPKRGETIVARDVEGRETHLMDGELVSMAPVEDRSVRSGRPSF